MRRPPVLPLWILTRFGVADDALSGDLVQEFAAGRSRTWLWRQSLAAVWLRAWRDVAAQPVRAIKSVTIGWALLLLLFWLFGDPMADGLAGLVFDWDRQLAYAGEQQWWPFWIAAGIVSYSVLALSGYAVAALSRRAPALLLVYVTTIEMGLVISAVAIAVLTARWGQVPVPHLLFYFVSVGLPHHLFRAGFLLAPLLALLGGLAAGRASDRRPQIVV